MTDQTTPEPTPGSPQDARKAAWLTLVRAWKADRAEPSETTAADLGAASFRYAALAGVTAEQAVRTARNAVLMNRPPRRLFVSYMTPEGRFGSMPVTSKRPLEDMTDVLELQADLRAELKIPHLVVMGWSLFEGQ